jgi:hypothetical protein
MKVSGPMTSNTAKVKKFGAMELRHTKETSLKERKMARVDSCGVMAHTMRVTSLMECFKDMVLTSLRILIKHTMASSIMARLKAMVK